MKAAQNLVRQSVQGVGRLFVESCRNLKRKHRALGNATRPVVEALEHRTLMTMVFPLDQYGPETPVAHPENTALQNPTVHLIFAGDWNGYQQSEQGCSAAAQSIMGGPYLTGLRQYGSLGTAVFGAEWSDSSDLPRIDPTNPPSGPSNDQLQAYVQQSVAAHGTDPGSHDIAHAPIYVVILSPAGNGGNGGYNITGTIGTPQENVNLIYIGTQTSNGEVGGPLDLSDGAYSFTAVFSHELTERSVNDATEFDLPPVYDDANGHTREAQACDGEAENHYLYKLNGYWVAPYYSVLDNAAIVPDIDYSLPQQQFIFHPLPWPNPHDFGFEYNLVVNGDQRVNKNDLITVGKDTAGEVVVTLNGETATYDSTQINSVTTSSGAGQDFIAIQNAVVPTSIISNSSVAGPDDNVLIGSTGSTQGIVAPVSISNSTGYDVIGISDANDSVARTVTVDSFGGPANLSGLVSNIFGTSQVAIAFAPAHTRSLFVDTGTGANTVNVQSTVVPTTITDHGNDSINIGGHGEVGSNHTVQGVHQNLTFGGTTPSVITVDDASDGVVHNVTLNDSATAGVGAISGLAPGVISYAYAQTVGMTINLGVGANNVSVQATGSPTMFAGGVARQLTINVGATAALSALTVTGGTTGGIHNHGTVSAVNCTISGNSSTANGAGIDNTHALTLVDCTIANNATGAEGGGIYNDTLATMTLVDCTLSGNLSTGTGSGGGIVNANHFSGSVTLEGSIVSGNLENSIIQGHNFHFADDLDGKPLAGSYDLIGADDTGSFADHDNRGDLVGENLLLGALTSNGGPTKTLATLPGSAAINAGSIFNFPNTGTSITLDQRGIPRNNGSITDIGSYENQGQNALVFSQGPANANVGVNQTVVVDIEQGGHLLSGDRSSVTLAIPTAIGGGTFTGGATSISVNASGGQARFTFSFTQTGTYTLIATDGSDISATATIVVGNPATSAPFLGFVAQPPAIVTSGVSITPAVVEVDQYVNTASGTQIDPTTRNVQLVINDSAHTIVGSATVNAHGQAFFPNLQFNEPPGQYQLTASAGTDVIATSILFTVNAPAAPITLAFGPAPINAAAGTTISPGITVTQSQNGSPLSDGSSVTLTLLSTSPSGGTLIGTLTRQVNSNGVATFNDLQPSTAGIYKITASDSADVGAELGFDVTQPAKIILKFASQPTNIIADQPLTTVAAPVIVDVTQNGATIDDNTLVTISLDNGGIPANFAAFAGTRTVQAVHGVATFDHLFLSTAATSYTLEASDANSSYIGATSNTFVVTPGAAHRVAVTGGSGVAAESITPDITAQLQDSFGNPIYSGSSDHIVLSIESGPAGASLSGTLTEPLQGIYDTAAFGGVSLDKAGSYTIDATDADNAGTLVGSADVAITAGASTQLAFIHQPGDTAAAFGIEPAMTVAVEDLFGNVVTSDSSPITLSIASPLSSGALLGGVITVNAQSGLATFSGVSVSQTGTFTLLADDGSYTPATSQSFNVVARTTLYVDKNSTSATHDGQSWNTAFIAIQPAVAAALSGDTIDVAQGDYSSGFDPDDTLLLKDGVTLQGGFQTGGADGPNPAAYPTILDGNGVNYHVVTASGVDSSAVLDGFTITGGNADGSGDANSGFGGGLIADAGSPTVTDCIFTANTAVSGGAMFNLNSLPTVSSCQFLDNSATSDGAIYNQDSNATLIDCLFVGNTSTQWAGAIYNFDSSPFVTNCTFTNNSAGQYGGAMENDYDSIPTLTNDIFWNDHAGFGGSEISNDAVDVHGGSAPIVNNSDVAGGYAGVANIIADPLFVNSADDNYQLQPTSPCINDGTDDAPGLVDGGTDLVGNPRTFDGFVDMGAFEAQAVSVFWTGAANDSNWGTPGNWSDNLVPTEFDDATIGMGFSTIQVNAGAYSVHTLLASSPVEITLAATLVLNGATTFSDGLTVDNSAEVQMVADPVVLDVTGLNVVAGGTIDLGDNDMIIRGSNIVDITDLIKSARAGGTWMGTGITSTSAMNNSKHNTTLGAMKASDFQFLYGANATFVGQSIDDTAVLVKYTYYGDANFNGKIDGGDYARIDASFNKEHTAGNIGGWFNGDFDYNGKVDGTDYALIDSAFNSQSTPLRPVNLLPTIKTPIIRH